MSKYEDKAKASFISMLGIIIMLIYLLLNKYLLFVLQVSSAHKSVGLFVVDREININ